MIYTCLVILTFSFIFITKTIGFNYNKVILFTRKPEINYKEDTSQRLSLSSASEDNSMPGSSSYVMETSNTKLSSETVFKDYIILEQRDIYIKDIQIKVCSLRPYIARENLSSKNTVFTFQTKNAATRKQSPSLNHRNE